MTLPPSGVPEPAAVSELADALRAELRGHVDTGKRRRAEYSSDASNYRVVPSLVAFPADIDDAVTAIGLAREHGVPLTQRGGGTSIAGNAMGPGLVLDFSRHCNRVLSIDPDARTATVEPGVILSDLQKAAAKFGLRFGPDPSTINRATLGGMIGNNACGPHAVAWGKTAENVVSLDVIDGTGRRFLAGAGDAGAVPGLDELVQANLAGIRTSFGRFSRQVSGYSLEHLLPENGRHLARFLVGSEGTLATTLGATVQLVPIAAKPTLIVLGYPDMIAAADDVPAILALRPLAIEGLDSRLVDVVRNAKGANHVPGLPSGHGWLMVEVGAYEGESLDVVADRVAAIAAVAQTDSVMIREAGPEADALWRIRADGAGLGGRTPAGAPAWPGWEDAAVPPERLGTYLRDFTGLMDAHGLDGLLYGHFGDGCVHVRIDMPLDSPATVPAAREFLEQSADLVVSYGGSLSGEHGDGRTRSELLSRMYGQDMMDVMAQVKELFDPDNLLNPGIIVNPDPIDANLRRPWARPLTTVGGRPAGAPGSGFAFLEDGGDFTNALHRCTGVGNCRAHRREAGFFMCPSYQATKDEKDVTRGRARVLAEVANGRLLADWGSTEVMESLDLCLSCKACSSDCPTGVDVARYKSEALFRAYRKKLRPRTHYVLGMLPRWTRLAARIPGAAALTNAVMSIAPVRRLAFRIAGIDPRRGMPALAAARFTAAERPRASHAAPTPAPETKHVLLWADTFSDTLDSTGARDAITLLESAGYTVHIPPETACCGLTWISTGQLDGARRQLSGLLEQLAPFAVNGIPIVGVEPSCTAVIRSDLRELFPDDPRVEPVVAMTHTLAELLTAPEPIGPGDAWTAPDLTGTEVIAQPHCHHYSVMGWDADRALLELAGATVTELAGCCGLAGNFGMEAGHYDVSVKVAQAALLPALEENQSAIYLADGFSCRTQAEDLAGRSGVHLATLLANASSR